MEFNRTGTGTGIGTVTGQIKPILRQIPSENNHTDLTCMDKFKRNWKPILAGVALIAGGTLTILTGLIAGGALTFSGLFGNIPGFIAGPAATYCLLGSGGAMVGAGVTLIGCSFFYGGPTDISAPILTTTTNSSVSNQFNVPMPHAQLSELDVPDNNKKTLTSGTNIPTFNSPTSEGLP
ncbi:hypothetical protein AAKU67_001499 [Oxalobacteraceae bacterium GrIS 2.11]